jgi:hypothetical protein
LTPDTALTGIFARDATPADVDAVLDEIEQERLEEQARQRRREQADVA